MYPKKRLMEESRMTPQELTGRNHSTVDTVSDDQPLSKWFEGRHSPTPIDGAAAAPEVTVEQSTEAIERELEIVESPPVSASGDNFSFVRNTPLWETVKSMEVFRVIPQDPHFHPLDGVKESAREGLALGSMVTFSTVVDNTSKLRFDHPRTTIDESLETLLELENYGFDVKLIRDRLTALLLVKDKQEELEEILKGIGEKMEAQKVEAMGVDEKLVEIDMQIRKFQERRAQLEIEMDR